MRHVKLMISVVALRHRVTAFCHLLPHRDSVVTWTFLLAAPDQSELNVIGKVSDCRQTNDLPEQVNRVICTCGEDRSCGWVMAYSLPGTTHGIIRTINNVHYLWWSTLKPLIWPQISVGYKNELMKNIMLLKKKHFHTAQKTKLRLILYYSYAIRFQYEIECICFSYHFHEHCVVFVGFVLCLGGKLVLPNFATRHSKQCECRWRTTRPYFPSRQFLCRGVNI